MKKKYLSILTIALAALLLVCTFSFSVSAEEATTPTVSIDKFNLVFEDNVYLKYAVKFGGIDDSDIAAENIGMLYFSTPCDDYTAGNESYSSGVVGHTTISGQKYYTFEYRHVTTREMTDYVYSVAYIDVDGVRYYSAPVKYSVLDYCYSKLGKTGVASDNEEYIKLLIATLEQGAAAQEYFDYNTNRLANAEYYLVEVVGGTLEDGFTKGLYLSKDKVTLTAPETNGDLVFAEWQNGSGESVSISNVSEITDFTKNDTYTAIYKSAVKYSEGLAFTSNGDGTCYVSGIGTCTDTEIVIPPTSPAGDSVTGIGKQAFYNCSSLTKVEIPDGVTNISYGAFWSCSLLTEIVIPDSVVSVGANSFRGCSRLAKIGLPNSLTSIENGVFLNCISLTEIVIPDSVKSIGYQSFYGCLFTEIVIPDNVAAIGNFAFQNCTLLNEMVIPNGVKNIGEGVFYGCTSLNKIVIPDSVKSIGNSAFNMCTSLTEIKIPETVYLIGSSAFAYCRSLKEINIPNAVESIYESTFDQCGSLTKIVIPKSVMGIGSRAFYGCSSLTNVHYTGNEEQWAAITILSYNDPLKNSTIYYYSEETPSTEGNFWHYVDGVPTVWSAFLAPKYSDGLDYTCYDNGTCWVGGIGTCTDTDIVIPCTYNGLPVVGIMWNAFENCKQIKSVVIPNSVTTIGGYAFKYCFSLESVVIPNSVTRIKESAFYNCTSLKSVTIPDSVTMIERYTFANCIALTNIVIPDSVTVFYEYAFDTCSSLTSVCYTGSEEQWSEVYAYYNNDPIKTANITYNYVPEE